MKPWADNVTAILPERLLHAYVDVLLPSAKRRAVHFALRRQPELRESVEIWRKQNADLRHLALLQTPGPMPAAMAGATHRLETRLCRFAPLEGLRIAALIALLLTGVAGVSLMTQAQLNKGSTLGGIGQNAAAASQPHTKPIPAAAATAEPAKPEQTVETVVMTVEAPTDELKNPADVAQNESRDGLDQKKLPETPIVSPPTSTPPISERPDPAPSIAETPKPATPPRDI